MAGPSFTDAALSAGSKIGRYFSIVTLVPSLLLTLWVYALFASDAWRHEPHLDQLLERLGDWSLAGVSWVILAALLVGLFIHPLQFPTVQLLEGYWGSSLIARGAMRLRIGHYRRRARHIKHLMGTHQDALDEAFETWHGAKASKQLDEEDRAEAMSRFLNASMADHAIVHAIAIDAFKKSLKRYPEARRVLPTRLGNALRSVEDTAGRQYGLDVILTAPHFALVASEAHVAYVDDSQEEFDTAVRLCSVSLIATVITVPAVLSDGLWLLIALIPYALAWIAYRAAVSAADEYMTAVSTVMDLNRFALYKQLGLPQPRDTAEERDTNKRLMALLEYDGDVDVTYARDAATASSPRRLSSRRRPGSRSSQSFRHGG
jgi:hypothetical protein